MNPQISTEFWNTLADQHKRAREQADFQRAISHYCKGLEAVNIGCHGSECEYADGDENHQCEPGFSWSQCDSCGSTLGGDRHPAIGCWSDDDGFHTVDMEVCADCAMYHANGELPESWNEG